jgi:hypothetical protein
MLKIGDKIKINDPRALYHGQPGVIIRVREGTNFPYQVRMAPDEDSVSDFWFTAGEVEKAEPAPIRPTRPEPEESAGDFDKGFGIGGLARHEEPPFVSTVKQIERLERLEKKARRCRRCGQTDVFDGAMFTTIAGGDICDDCVG